MSKNSTMSIEQRLHLAKRQEVIAALVVVILGISVFSVFLMRDADNRPLLWALQIELAGGKAYGPEMEALFHEHYPERYAEAGFAYPLPAMWLALPIVFLPDMVQDHMWTLLTIALVVVGLRLHRMSLFFLLYFPLVVGIYYRQVTPMLVGLLLIGMWAVAHKRWWLTGMIVALTIAAKPQTTLLLSSVLAVLALYRGGGKQIVTCGAVVALATFALEPTWMQQWFAAMTTFSGTIQREMLWQLLPVAFVLWWRGYRWGAAAVIQHTMFLNGISFFYGLAVLIPAYTHLREARLLRTVLVASWIMYPVWLFSIAIYAIPTWVVLGGTCFLPLIWYALREQDHSGNANVDDEQAG